MSTRLEYGISTEGVEDMQLANNSEVATYIHEASHCRSVEVDINPRHIIRDP